MIEERFEEVLAALKGVEVGDEVLAYDENGAGGLAPHGNTGNVNLLRGLARQRDRKQVQGIMVAVLYDGAEHVPTGTQALDKPAFRLVSWSFEVDMWARTRKHLVELYAEVVKRLSRLGYSLTAGPEDRIGGLRVIGLIARGEREGTLAVREVA